MTVAIKRTFCRGMDDGGCGLCITVENGRVVKIAGDPESPLSRGFICHRGKAYRELLYHPDRLLYPQKRTGARGAGKWQRISWDEALDFAAGELTGVKEKYGAKAIFFGCGSPKGLEVFFSHRLASCIGTPNVATPASVCHMPRELGHTFTLGGPSYPDVDHPPKSLILWGINPLDNNVGGSDNRIWLKNALKSKARMIVIDPRKTALAAKADLWVKIRPGTDAALALAVLKITVDEKLYDPAFVAQWTVGWAELQEYLAALDLRRLAEITWVEPEQITEIARIYAAGKPGVIFLGNPIDHSPDSFQASRALAILKAITGNVDVPGGEVIHLMPPMKRPVEFSLAATRKNQHEMLGAEFQVARRNLFVPRHLLPRAILEGKPYPLRAMLLFATNPLLTAADAALTHDALKALDFLMVTDLFMTPTAELADLVLPATVFLEHSEIGYYGTRYGRIVARPKVVSPSGECRSDIDIINEMGKRLGYREHFWENVDEALDEILEPSGLRFTQFQEKGILFGERRYHKYEGKGFSTPSGKVEIYSRQLRDMGYAPLPTFTEPPSAPGYPLVLTCAKSPQYHHSGYRQIKSLRRLSPGPLVTVNPETARELGLRAGDSAYIETAKGRIVQKIVLDADLDPRVIFADYAWWFPEESSDSLHGWRESNLNILTDGDAPAEPAVGSIYLRGIPCRLRKA